MYLSVLKFGAIKTERFRVIQVKEVDFSEVLSELNGWGWSDYKLADEIGMSRSAITKLRNGERREPAYNDGCRIVKLHQQERRRNAKHEA